MLEYNPNCPKLEDLHELGGRCYMKYIYPVDWAQWEELIPIPVPEAFGESI